MDIIDGLFRTSLKQDVAKNHGSGRKEATCSKVIKYGRRGACSLDHYARDTGVGLRAYCRRGDMLVNVMRPFKRACESGKQNSGNEAGEELKTDSRKGGG